MRAVLALAILLLASCSGEPAGGPEQAVASFYRGFESGDCTAVREVVLRPDDLDCTVVTESAGALAAEGIDLDQASYAAGDVVDDSTTVTVSWGEADDAETVDVQRVDGDWLVVLDSAA